MRGDLETRFYAAVDPFAYLVRLDRPIRREAERRRYTTPDCFLNGQSLPSSWVIDEAVVAEALSHRRPTRHDDQVRVLEPACHPVQVVESRRDPDDPLPALHLQRDPLHRGTQQVVKSHQLTLVAVVGDAEHE